MTFRPVIAGGAPSNRQRQRHEQHAAEEQLPTGRREPVAGAGKRFVSTTPIANEMFAARPREVQVIEAGARAERDEADAQRGDDADREPRDLADGRSRPRAARRPAAAGPTHRSGDAAGKSVDRDREQREERSEVEHREHAVRRHSTPRGRHRR